MSSLETLLGVGALALFVLNLKTINRWIARATQDYKVIEIHFEDGSKMDLEYFDDLELKSAYRELADLARTSGCVWGRKPVREFHVLHVKTRLPAGL